MTDDRRTQHLDALAAHVLAHGLGNSSLRTLAAAIGTSDRMLLYYFRDKADLIGALLDHLAQRLTSVMDAAAPSSPLPPDALVRHVTGLLLSADGWPYMRVWLDMVARASARDPVYSPAARRIGQHFLKWAQNNLLAEDRHRAPAVMARIEGIVVLKAIGLGKAAEGAID